MDTNAKLKVGIMYGLEKCDLDVVDFATIIGCCTKTARKYLKYPTLLTLKDILALEKFLKIDLINIV